MKLSLKRITLKVPNPSYTLFNQSPSLPGSVGQADPSAWVATHEKKKGGELINLELGNSDFFPSLGGPTTFSGVRKKILTKKSGTVQHPDCVVLQGEIVVVDAGTSD